MENKVKEILQILEKKLKNERKYGNEQIFSGNIKLVGSRRGVEKEGRKLS